MWSNAGVAASRLKSVIEINKHGIQNKIIYCKLRLMIITYAVENSLSFIQSDLVGEILKGSLCLWAVV